MQKSNFAEMNISRIWRVSKQTSFTVELGKKGTSKNNGNILFFWGGALCVEMRYYADISLESRCNTEINVWAHLLEISHVNFLGQ